MWLSCSKDEGAVTLIFKPKLNAATTQTWGQLNHSVFDTASMYTSSFISTICQNMKRFVEMNLVVLLWTGLFSVKHLSTKLSVTMIWIFTLLVFHFTVEFRVGKLSLPGFIYFKISYLYSLCVPGKSELTCLTCFDKTGRTLQSADIISRLVSCLHVIISPETCTPVIWQKTFT